MESELAHRNPRLTKLYNRVEDWKYYHDQLQAAYPDGEVHELFEEQGEVERELLSMGFKIATDEFYDKVILIPTFLTYPPKEEEEPEEKREHVEPN